MPMFSIVYNGKICSIASSQSVASQLIFLLHIKMQQFVKRLKALKDKETVTLSQEFWFMRGSLRHNIFLEIFSSDI